MIAACISNNRFVDEKAMQAAIRKLEWPPYVERSGNLPKEYLCLDVSLLDATLAFQPIYPFR